MTRELTIGPESTPSRNLDPSRGRLRSRPSPRYWIAAGLRERTALSKRTDFPPLRGTARSARARPRVTPVHPGTPGALGALRCALSSGRSANGPAHWLARKNQRYRGGVLEPGWEPSPTARP